MNSPGFYFCETADQSITKMKSLKLLNLNLILAELGLSFLILLGNVCIPAQKLVKGSAVVECSTRDRGPQVRASLNCVLEQDTFILA